MGKGRSLVVVLLLILVGVGWFATFIIDERERAIMFRLGEIVRTDFEPGLHFKVPILNQIKKFDGRIQTLDVQPERFLTVEKKNVIVDSFVKWRIEDVGRFYTAVSGDALQAGLRLEQIIKDGLRSEFSKRTINEVVSGERGQIMDILTNNANQEAQRIGISVIDLRVMRIDLPSEVSNSVYLRMEAERSRVARDFRSRGAEAAERIRADADRQRTVLLAEAYRDAETTRGEGDARAADIYAQAYGKNEEFYAFYRSLDSYRAVFNQQGDMLVLEPDSDFFRYFRDIMGSSRSR